MSLLRWVEPLVRGNPPRAAEQLARARCVLFLQYEAALGSNVHATPVYEAFKIAVPDSTIIVACGTRGFEVLKHNPFVDRLVQTPDPCKQLFSAIRFLRRYLHGNQLVPEAIVTNLGNVRRSEALLALAACRAIRAGYTLAPGLYHFTLQRDRSLSLIANNLRLIGMMGHTYSQVEPRVAFSETDLLKAEQWFRQIETGPDAPRAVYITQTSPTQRKSWPADRFVAVADYAAAKHGAIAVFIGASQEAAAIESIRGRIRGETVSLAGQTTIAELAALLASSDLAISLDTGNMHIARSMNLPTIVLAPAWDPGVEWLPWGRDQFRIFKGEDIPFAPEDYQILEVQAAEVMAAMDDLLARYPPSAAARRLRVERGLSSVRMQTRRPTGSLTA